MERPEEILRAYCRKRNMRYTPEREAIIREIYRTYKHFDVDLLFVRIRENNPNTRLCKATIYRTIPHLVEAGLVRESLTRNGHACYEPTSGRSHHDHMRCIGCGRIYEFYEPSIDRAQERLCTERGFLMTSHIHVIEGNCSRCRKKRSRSKGSNRQKKGS